MAYQQMQGYPVYQNSYVQPYQDRLSQLQNQYQQVIPQVQQQPQINQGLLWVQGEAGAKSYLVAPNTTVLLMDADAQRFYIKSTDAAGMPSLRTFEFSEVLQTSQKNAQTFSDDLDNKYVTREEFASVREQYGEIMAKINELQSEQVKQTEQIEKTRGSKKGMNTDEQSIV